MFNSEKGTRLRLPGGAVNIPWVVPALAVLTVMTGLAALTACGSSASSGQAPVTSAAPASGKAASAGAISNQAPVPAESNPPGDIPDTTVYMPYLLASGHLLLRVPEGWSTGTAPASSKFASNLNTISVSWLPMSAAPTVASVRSVTIPALRARSLAFRLQDVRAVSLQGGPAVEVVYQLNSQPNAVTGRQYRLVVERFEMYRNGRGAVLELSSAVGSDNVDPWRIVSESFRWR